ncbi:MAG: FecR domain-containing protein [Pseudomonadota bacterium]
MQQEAVDWVHKLASGRATLADAEALKGWLRRSPLHAQAYADASRVWKEFGPAARELRQRGEISPGLTPLPRASGALSRRAVLGGFALTASAAAGYAVFRPPFDLWPSFDELRADFRTRTGQQKQLALSGDVSVRLNTQTSLALRSSGEFTDRIELIAGEASFTAPKASRHSLVVLAASGATTANGARFNMRRDDTSVCVTCLEGDIRVERQGRVVLAGPGQQVRYDDSGLEPAITIDPELVVAWQEGALIFRMTPLREVVDEINRYRPGRVILLNAALGEKPVSGRFQIDHMDEILVRLDQAFGAKSRFLPGGIVLLS